jgi:hypothetical protein
VRHHKQHNDTFKVGISWAIAVLRNHTMLLSPFRAALMIQRYPQEGNVSRLQLVQDYQTVLGLGTNTAYSEIRDLLATQEVDGLSVAFGRTATLPKKGPVLKRNSFRWLAERNGILDLGVATITREALTSGKKFRQALYEIFLMANAAYQEDEGYVTISRQGITRLVGLSEGAQHRYERDLGVEVRENHAIPVDWSDTRMMRRYGARVKNADIDIPGRLAVQIRNSYRPIGRFVTRIQLSESFRNRKRLESSDLRLDVEDTLGTIRTERGDSVAKQTFSQESALRGPTAVRTSDVVLVDRPISNPHGYRQYHNPPRVRRYFMRYHAGATIVPGKVQDMLDYIQSPAWHADWRMEAPNDA